jgi:hypothetical protein
VPVSLVVMGDALVVIGFAIVFVVFMENSYASSVVQVEAEQRVISTGLSSPKFLRLKPRNQG